MELVSQPLTGPVNYPMGIGGYVAMVLAQSDSLREGGKCVPEVT